MNELDLFTEALNRADPAERAAFLDQACAGNADLRRRLEELLAGHARVGSPLDRPPVAPGELGNCRPADSGFDRSVPARRCDGDARPYRSRYHHRCGPGRRPCPLRSRPGRTGPMRRQRRSLARSRRHLGSGLAADAPRSQVHDGRRDRHTPSPASTPCSR